MNQIPPNHKEDIFETCNVHYSLTSDQPPSDAVFPGHSQKNSLVNHFLL